MSSANPDAPAPKRKARVSRKHTVGRVMLASALVLALVTGLSSVWFYRHLNGNITTQSLAGIENRPDKVYNGNGESLNILVLGSDTRACEGCGVDDVGGRRSDTTILVHLSADRKRAYAISIPRDSVVDRPACGDSPAATDVLWNEAYSVGGAMGGARCTLTQLEQDAGIYVDHFVVIDFNGFGNVVDAVGGVPVCVPEDIKDPAHGIFVPAGNPSVLTGDQALDYVRARYVGELIQQNDISRIKRQQTFIAALVRKVKSAGTLTRLDRIVAFLDAATKTLTTDDGLGTVTRIGKIGLQLQNIGLDKIKFVTLPTDYYPVGSEHSGKVFWTKDATTIWHLIRDDKPLPPSLLKDSLSAADPESPGDGTTGSPSPTDTPSQGPSPTETPTETPSQTPTETGSPTPTEEPIPGICA